MTESFVLDRLEQLKEAAVKVRNLSYARYSKFKVGCAVLLKNGNVYIGTNVENSSYGLTICAERSAFCNMCAHEVPEERRIAAVVVAGGHEDNPPDGADVFPCGACRQFMAEFAGKSGFLVYVTCPWDPQKTKSYRIIDDLLPHAFIPDHLAGRTD